MNKKIAIISGATSGIGKCVAEACIKEGIFVIMLGRSVDKMRLFCSKHGNHNCDYFYMDMQKSNEIEVIVDQIMQKYDHIDILVNCAGIPGFGSVLNMEISKTCSVITVNLLGTIFLTNEIAKYMVQNKSGQIIIIDSIAGTKAFEYGSAYVISKFGQVGYAQVLWEELKKYEIKVCSIRPGLVSTEFYNELADEIDTSDGLLAEDIAYVVLNVINQSERSNISEVVVRPLKTEGQTLFSKIIAAKYQER